MRKVFYSEITEHKSLEDCNFKNQYNPTYIDDEIIYRDENGNAIYSSFTSDVYVSEKVFSIGGFYQGIVNGKYQVFNIYY